MIGNLPSSVSSNPSSAFYGALAAVPTHPSLESRAVEEFLPGFTGHAYIIWTLFFVWIFSSAMLALWIDHTIINKGRSLV